MPRLVRADSTVVFNEIMYHPATNEAALEWVELYNQMAIDMDLSGWALAGGIQYEFAEGTVLAGGGCLVVASSPSELAATTGLTNIYGPFTGRLGNAGERLELRNNNRRLMDALNYRDENPWPVEPDGTGVSLAKIESNLAGEPAANWAPSRQCGGTPGAPNFPAAGDVTFPAGLVTYWNFNETNGPALDLANGISGTLAPGVRRRAGIVGSGAVFFDPTSNAYISVDARFGAGFSGASGITVEGLLAPVWNGSGHAVLFRKAESQDADLISYWSFDEANSGTATASDQAGSNHGTFQGSAVRTNGLSGLGAALFRNQSIDAVNVGAGINNSFSVTRGMTIAAWINSRWSGAGGDYDEIFRKEDGNDRILLSFQNDANNGGAVPPVAPGPVLSFGLNTAGTYSELDLPLDGAGGRPTLASLTDGRPHHVAASYDSVTGLKTIYIDGVRRHSTSLAGIIHSGGMAAATIGNISASGGEPFNGTIDEVALWGTALSSNQVLTLAKGASPLTLFQTNLNNDTQIALALRERSQVEDTNSPAATGPVLAFGLNVDGVYRELDMPLDGVAGRPTLAELQAGPGHHMAATYDVATGLMAVYFNGVRQSSTNLSGNLSLGGNTPVTIGNAAAGGNEPFSGTIDELAVWNRALAEGEIAAHFQAAQSGRTYFSATVELTGVDLAFNEVASGTNDPFWVELVNYGGADIPLEGYVLARLGGTYREYIFPAQVVAPGSPLVLTRTTLGFGADPGDKLVLYPPQRQRVLDAVLVKSSARARFSDGTGPWLHPAEPTPGASNRFAFHRELVINEIMYHHRPLEAAAAVYQDTALLPIDARWKYDQSGADPEANWRGSNFDDRSWAEGAALLYVEDAALPAVKSTPLTLGRTTYYFRSRFVFSGSTNGLALSLHPILDDGAVFYLNGVEVFRYNLPDREINDATLANPSVADAVFIGPISIPASSLVIGTNVVAVEVHQATTNSSDIVFGTELLARIQLRPEVPFGESPGAWIELYNRSTNSVDLTGWELRGGIDFTFPNGPPMAPDSYLVVAQDADYLRTLYPAITILGNFTNRLSGRSDRIELRDEHQNPVNTVRYFEDSPWPSYADGGGSSLELRDPRADTTQAGAWAASDEAGQSVWQTYSYQGIASAGVGPTRWNEFVLGLLEAGEVLLDDISVVESPAGTARELLQNGRFENGLTSWRIIGNHRTSKIIVDPDHPANHVLNLVASGPTEHMHNHAETTLAGGASIVNGREYRVSFRAKWLAGSNQLHTRLYFNRLARMTRLKVPDRTGTPGRRNSRYEPNIGPTFSHFAHTPPVPAANQPVTISVRAADPDGVSAGTLWRSVNGAAWTSQAMSASAGGFFTATVPGLPAASIVQFYVEGMDGLGTASTCPVSGRNSRALYKVNDGQAALGKLHHLRLILTAADANRLYAATNVMSNEYLGATVVYDEREVFYDAGVHLKGSERGRTDENRIGFLVRFPSDHRFRGVNASVGIDRSGGWRFGTTFGQDEILIKHIINHAGGIPDMYDDLVRVIAPASRHTGSALLLMARFGQDFLDSQFVEGSQGAQFKYELIYYPTSTVDGNPQSPKNPLPDDVIGVAIRDLGADKELYRWNFLPENHRDRDDYSSILALAKAFSLTGNAYYQQTRDLLDLDEWLRTFALFALVTPGDNYASGAQHNLLLYSRPVDRKIMAFPLDMDFAFVLAADAPLVNNADLSKLLGWPANQRLFYGHLQDLIRTTYNPRYMARWTAHYGSLLPGQNLASILTYIGQRVNYVQRQLPQTVPFAITTNQGQDFMVNSASVLIAGTAGINLKEIRLADRPDPLGLAWPSLNTWQAIVPLILGLNRLQWIGYDFAGQPVATNTLTVVSSATDGAPDSDQDGLPDLWERQHHFDPIANDAALDPDGDGLTNVQEYLSGTDPREAKSLLRLEALPAGAGGVRLGFQAIAGRSYAVEYREGSLGAAWTRLTNYSAQASSSWVEVADSPGPDRPSRYYRLVRTSGP